LVDESARGRYRPDNSGLYRINVDGKIGFMDRSGKTSSRRNSTLPVSFQKGWQR